MAKRLNDEELEERAKALEQENLWLRGLADRVPGLVAYVDRDGVYRFVNRRYEEWFGRAPEEVIGRHYTEVLGEEAGARIRDYVERALSGERVYFEEVVPYARGGKRWVKAEYVPDRDDQGELRGYFGFVTDITPLRQARDLLEAVTAGTNVLIATVDRDLCYTFFNQRHHEELERLTGKGTAIGMSIGEVFAEMPEERAKAVALWRRALAGEVVVETIRFGDPGRYRRWYSTRYTPLRDPSGAIVGAGVVTNDVTQLLEAQEALRKLNAELEQRVAEQTMELRKTYEVVRSQHQRLYDTLEALPVYVALLSRDHHVSFANRSFRERFGESQGRRCFEYLFQRTEPCENCEAQKVLQTGAPHHWNWIGPDGRNYEIYDLPFKDTDGTLMILEMGIDVTARRQAEDVLKTQRDLFVSLCSVRDRPTTLRLCLEAAIRLSAMDCGGIYLTDGSGGLRLAHSVGLSDSFVKAASYYPPDAANTLLVMAGEPIYTQHAALIVPPSEAKQREGLQALAVVPIRHGDRVIGCLNVASRRAIEVSLHGRAALETVASGAGLLITRALVDEELLTQSAIVQTMTEGVCLVRASDLAIVYANPRFERMFGYRPGEMTGLPVARVNYASPDSSAEQVARDIVAQIEKTGEAEYEVLNVRKDGTSFWCLAHTTTLDHPQFGRVWVAVHQDITERKLLENDLRESEEKYRTLFEAESDAVLLVDDATLAIRDANAAAVALYQYSRDELLAREVLTLSAEPELSLRVIRERAEAVPLRWHLKKDGTRFPVEITRRMFEWDGRKVHVAAIRDISWRLEAEKELRDTHALLTSILENAPALIYVNTLDRRYRLVNKAWQKFTGKSQEEVAGLTIEEIFSANTAKQFVASNRRVIKTGLPVTAEEAVMQEGRKRVLYSTKFPLLSAGGEIEAVGGISVDISDRKRAEEDLRRSQEHLYQAQKMETLGTLVAGVAHEINNPVSLILFNAPLLRKIWQDIRPVMKERAVLEPNRKYGGLTYEFLSKDLDRLLEDMELAGTRIAGIVQGLKNFARGSDVAEKAPMSLNEAVEGALRLARTALRKSGVKQLQVDLGTDLPAMPGNRQGIEQIVLNLLINGMQAIKQEQGKIVVSTAHDTLRHGLILCVSDNGEGIKPSFSARIFDPFFTTRQGQGGTGLGLAVTHSLVREHNGRITFESEVGKGTTFRVFFPLRKEEKRFKILVVDDDASMRKMLRTAFARASRFEVRTARNGTEALLELGTYRPDVLILDLLMPGMDGLEVCRTLRESPELSRIAVVIITGHMEDPRLEKIRRLGYEHIYAKPLHIERFVEEVEDIVDRGSGIVVRESGIGDRRS